MTAKPFKLFKPWVFGLIFGFAFGMEPKPIYAESSKPPQKAIRAKPKVIDLDFTDDDDDIPEHRPVALAGVNGKAGSGQWIYWTVGASMLAGGVGWYFLEAREKDPIVTRKEQVFTDERY